MTTDLIPAGTYGIEAIGNFAELLTEELGEDLNIRELFPQIKTPSGGGLTVDDPFAADPSKPDQLTDFKGVVIGERLRTVTYFTKFDERTADSSSRPDMWSDDGITQQGVAEANAKIKALNDADGGNRPYATVELAKCPYNNFGQALWISPNVLTNTYKDLFIKFAEYDIPASVVLPYASIRGWNSFKQSTIAQTRQSITASEIEFSLVRDTNAGNTTYSKWAFKRTGNLLPAEEVKAAKELGKQILATVVAASSAQATYDTPDTIEASTFGTETTQAAPSTPANLDAAFAAAGAPADVNI